MNIPCSACKGRPFKRKDCKLCGGTGFVPETQFEDEPAPEVRDWYKPRQTEELLPHPDLPLDDPEKL